MYLPPLTLLWGEEVVSGQQDSSAAPSQAAPDVDGDQTADLDDGDGEQGEDEEARAHVGAENVRVTVTPSESPRDSAGTTAAGTRCDPNIFIIVIRLSI